jgi:PmbA protein
MERNSAEDLGEQVLNLARRAGADDAEVMVGSGTEFEVTVRRGRVDKLIDAGSRSLGLRVFKDGKCSSTYCSDFTPGAIARFVERAIQFAQIAEPDPLAALPDWEERGGTPDLAMFDPSIPQLSTDKKVDSALRCEEAAFALDSRITNSDGATFGTHVSSFVLINSRGFSEGYESSVASIAVEVMAGDADGKKRNDSWISVERSLHLLESPEDVGRRAAERALRRLGARKVPTQSVPIVFDPLAAAGLLRTLTGAVSGASLDRRATFLLGLENTPAASKLVSIVDDPLMPGRLGSRPFDDEGIVCRRNPIFDEGVFRQFLFDTYNARKTGHRSTGSCRRGIGGPPGIGTSNFYLQPGSTSPKAIIESVDQGLYVTDMMGFGVNLATGDFSRGAGGLWIENGRVAFPVTEVTISGNLRQMLMDIEIVGNDIEWRGSVAAPTIKLQSMMVGGL